MAQTVLPSELCIVDSSDEAPARTEIERLCGEAGIRLEYVHPAPAGLPRQRNIGIDHTSGDPVFFIDDDAVMEPDVHEVVLAEYERWGPEIGGVRGTWLEPPAAGQLSILWRRFFGMETWRPEASGRMRPGFFTDVITISAEPRRVESFVGWFMSFRREVFESTSASTRISATMPSRRTRTSRTASRGGATSSCRPRRHESLTQRQECSASRPSSSSA